MFEATKTKKIWPTETLNYLKGEGIDIGCGLDPIFPGVDRFDIEQGDANEISKFVNKQYDFVFSSHTLEHMRDPDQALVEWLRILKPGGILIVIVPDEDLYEQGRFPSIFNGDHKYTFTISKARSWSPKSINILDLVKNKGSELVSIELQDHNYDRNLVKYFPNDRAQRLWQRFLKWIPYFKSVETELKVARIFHLFGSAIDQTFLRDSRLAQIQFILRKKH